jgi:hypothetical protein
MSSVTNQDLIELLEVLYQGRRIFTTTTFFTIEEIIQMATLAGLPLPADLEATLQNGLRRGVYLRCTLPGTEITGSPQFQYAYNPDMLRVNYANRQLMNPLCLSLASLQTGSVVTAANNRCPCPGKRGSWSADHGPAVASYAGYQDGLRPQFSDQVIAGLQRCCANNN